MLERTTRGRAASETVAALDTSSPGLALGRARTRAVVYLARLGEYVLGLLARTPEQPLGDARHILG